MKYAENQYQIPRGRVFFDEYVGGVPSGEQPFGNCPGITLTIDTSKAEHFSSETGLRQKDKAITVEVNRTGKVSCDNVSMTNLARFFSGTEETVTQAAGSVTDAVMTVKPGRFYQLGADSANPAGVRNITALSVKAGTGSTTYVAGTDYEVDLALGRLQILESGTITAGDIKVSYTRPAATWSRVKTGSASELKGALRVVADNASGDNRDFYLPSVTLTPSGDMPIIADGTDFTQFEFGLEVLKPANGEAIYVDGRPVTP